MKQQSSPTRVEGFRLPPEGPTNRGAGRVGRRVGRHVGHVGAARELVASVLGGQVPRLRTYSNILIS